MLPPQPFIEKSEDVLFFVIFKLKAPHYSILNMPVVFCAQTHQCQCTDLNGLFAQVETFKLVGQVKQIDRWCVNTHDEMTLSVNQTHKKHKVHWHTIDSEKKVRRAAWKRLQTQLNRVAGILLLLTFFCPLPMYWLADGVNRLRE